MIARNYEFFFIFFLNASLLSFVKTDFIIELFKIGHIFNFFYEVCKSVNKVPFFGVVVD